MILRINPINESKRQFSFFLLAKARPKPKIVEPKSIKPPTTTPKTCPHSWPSESFAGKIK